MSFNLKDYNEKVKNYIGVNVWWDIQTASIPVGLMKETLSSVGLNPDLIDRSSNKVAFKRAGKALTRIRHENATHATMSRPIADKPNTVVIGIVSETVEKNDETLDYQVQTTARLDKETGKISVEGKHGDAMLTKYRHFKRVVTGDDIRGLLKFIIEQSCGGCALRRHGGIYFVPKIKVGLVAKLEELVSKLDCGSLTIFRVSDASTERQVAWQSVEDEIIKKIDRITFAVGNIEKREPAIKRQSDRLDKVQNMLEYYVELCDTETVAQSITAKLQAAEKLISDKIAEIQKNTKE